MNKADLGANELTRLHDHSLCLVRDQIGHQGLDQFEIVDCVEIALGNEAPFDVLYQSIDADELVDIVDQSMARG